MALQTQLERIAAKGQVVALTFMQDAVAASQTNANLPLIETGATTGTTAVTTYEMPYPFDILSQSFVLSAAATAGTLTINPTIAGTVTTAIGNTVTTAAAGYDKGLARGEAGDSVGVQIDTDGSWDATTADLAVTLFVMIYLDNV